MTTPEVSLSSTDDGDYREGGRCPSCGAILWLCDCEDSDPDEGHIICSESGDDAADCTEPKSFLTWDEIVEHCSRLHTTKVRTLPWGSREGSDTLRVTVLYGSRKRPVTIVPTRMHEPGFYWRFDDLPAPENIRRSFSDAAELQESANNGWVQLAEGASL